MGKKKKKFIDKKTAASFHIIHHSSGTDEAHEDASIDPSSSLASLSLHSPPIPPPSTSSSSSSRYFLQPSRNVAALPRGFPADLLLTPNSVQLQALLREEERQRRKRDREAADVTALPHDYDYTAHLRDIGGGFFIAGSGGAGMSKRERRENAERRVDLRSAEAMVEDPLEAEVDWALVKKAEAEGRRRRHRQKGATAANIPADVRQALEEAEGEEAALGMEEMEDDFVVKAMMGGENSEAERGVGDDGDEKAEEDEEEEEEEEEDFDHDDIARRIRAFEAAARDQRSSQQQQTQQPHSNDGQHNEEEEEDEEEDDEDDGWEDEDDEDEEEEDEQKGGSSGMNTNTAAPDDERHSEVEEEEEEEWDEGVDSVPALPKSALDEGFERLLAEEYNEEDIGGLDGADDADLNGQLPLSSFSAQIDRFLERPSLPVSEGGATVVIDQGDREELKWRMMRRLKAMETEGEMEEEADWMPSVYRSVIKQEWDVESILSTYSNTENHPTAISESMRTHQQRQHFTSETTAIAQLIARRAATLSIDEGTQYIQQAHEDVDEAGEENVEGENDGGRNKGEPRPRGETADEKRARKAASKAERRDARQRKKQMRLLYAGVDHSQHAQLVQRLSNNPTAKTM